VRGNSHAGFGGRPRGKGPAHAGTSPRGRPYIPMLPTLLDQIDDLAEVVVTADALHTQRATARYLHDRGAEFVFCVKENQPKLFAALNTLPWPRRYAATGASRYCTGYATPPTAKTTQPCAPDPDPESWPPSATSPSEHYA
jgi:hypothetical protein